MASVDVLELLLTARYAGRPAFNAFKDDLASLSESSNALTKLGAAMSAVGTLFIAGGLAMAAGVGYAVKAASDYDTAIQRIVSVTPALQNHQQALAQLNQEIAQAATQWGQSPTSIAQGSYFLMSAAGVLGANGVQQLLQNNIIGELAAFSRASGLNAEGGVSFSQAAQDLPRILTAANLPVSQWGGAMGVLTYLENQAHMTQSQMTSALGAYLPAMVALGMPFQDSATMLAAIASSGRVSAPAGREAMSALTLMFAGSSQQAELAKLGLNTGDFFSGGKMKPTDVVLAMLQSAIYSHAKSPADVLSIEHDLFGQVGLRAIGPLLSQGGFAKYQNLLQGERASGITSPQTALLYMNAVGERAMQAPSAQFDALKSSLELLAITIGHDVLPVVMQFVHWLSGVALNLTKIAAQHPQLVKALAVAGIPSLLGGGVGLKGLGGLLTYLGGTDKGADLTRGATLARYAGSFFQTMWEGGTALPANLTKGALNSIGFLGKPLGGLGTVLKYLTGNIPGQMDADFWASQKLGNLKDFGIGKLKNIFPEASRGAELGVPNLQVLTTGLGELAQHGKDALGALKGLAGSGFDALTSAITAGIPTLASFAGGLAAVALPVLLVVGAIATIVLLFTAFRKQGGEIVSFLAGAFAPAFHLIASTSGLAVETIKTAWNSAYPAINSAMNSLVGGITAALPLFQLIGIVVGAVVVVVVAAVTGLVAAFLSALGPIIRVFGDLFTFIGGILNLIVGLVTFNGDKIKTALGQIAGGFLGVFKDVGMALGNFVQSFVSTFLGFIGTIVNAVTGGALQKVGDAFNNMGQQIQNGFNQIFPPDGNSAMAQNFKSSMKTLITTQGNTYQQMNAQTATEAKQMYNYGTQLAQDLADGVYAEQQYENYNMQVYGHQIGEHIINGAKTALNIQSPSKVFYYLGQMVTLGMQQGILAGQSGVIQAAAQVSNAAINTARNTLKLHSPSQVFHEMGIMTMKGYQQGVSSHTMDWHTLLPGHVDKLHVGSIQTGAADANGPYRFARSIQSYRERIINRYNLDRDSLSYDYRLGYEYTA